MKMTFRLTRPKIKPARLADSARSDVKKYLKRERKKELPEGVDFWDFDCKAGATENDSKAIHVAEISRFISTAEEQNLDSFYVEIVAKPGRRTKRTGEAPENSSSEPAP